jgi:hypothetical protein
MGEDHEEGTVVSPSLDEDDRHTLFAERRDLCSLSPPPLLSCADDEKLARVQMPVLLILPLA